MFILKVQVTSSPNLVLPSRLLVSQQMRKCTSFLRLKVSSSESLFCLPESPMFSGAVPSNNFNSKSATLGYCIFFQPLEIHSCSDAFKSPFCKSHSRVRPDSSDKLHCEIKWNQFRKPTQSPIYWCKLLPNSTGFVNYFQSSMVPLQDIT